jgi:hypothetical protein
MNLAVTSTHSQQPEDDLSVITEMIQLWNSSQFQLLLENILYRYVEFGNGVDDGSTVDSINKTLTENTEKLLSGIILLYNLFDTLSCFDSESKDIYTANFQHCNSCLKQLSGYFNPGVEDASILSDTTPIATLMEEAQTSLVKIQENLIGILISYNLNPFDSFSFRLPGKKYF